MNFEESLERYSRQLVLKNIGSVGHKKIRSSHVTVVGVGGLGSSIAYPLAGIGIGTLRIIDQDIVSLSNLQRQLLYRTEDIGIPKVEAATQTINSLNPDVKVEPIAETISESNILDLLKETDIVIDGLDSFETRYIVNKACVKLGIPYVFGGALETYGNITTIIPNETPCLECIFPDMKSEQQLTCETVGVIPTILNVIGAIQANEAILYLTDQKPVYKNKLLFIDLDYGSFEKIDLLKREECKICGSKTVEETEISSEPQEPKKIEFSKPKKMCDGTYIFSTVLKQRIKDLDSFSKFFTGKVSDMRVSQLGIRFKLASVQISILKGGNLIVERVKNEDLAIEIAEKIEIWTR
ncbi:MAG: HesA/MoeB/ThiF family protein [Candidatus Ranarchaeia archaeon]